MNIKLVKERGQTKRYLQYEIILGPFDNIILGIAILNALKIFLKKQKFKLKPKPFASQYGNSLHINLSFNNLLLENIATQNTLQAASAILCHNIEKILLIFLNNKQSCKRLSNKFLSPTHICFGVDNRFSLIRILYSPIMRLEYRLADNNTNIYLAIYSILFLLYQHKYILIPTFNNKYYLSNILETYYKKSYLLKHIKIYYKKIINYELTFLNFYLKILYIIIIILTIIIY
ncbi:MAG: hypothetical protein U1E31_00870 [Rickettsiales bacterium]